jgi:hypothetical protein
MFALTLRHADHVRRYSVSRSGPLGWEIRLEADAKLQRLDHYRDWHRVERVLAQFEREVRELQESGWRVTEAQSMRPLPT